MLEKEWYDVEVEKEFFEDDVKELKDFKNHNKKEKKPIQNKKDDIEESGEFTDFNTFITNSIKFDDEVISKDVKDINEELIITDLKSTLNEEIHNIIETTNVEIENIDDEDDEKAPKLSFDDYVEENNINLDNLKANISAALYIAGDEGLDIPTLRKIVEQPTWFVKKLITIMIGEYWTNESVGISIELYQKVFKFVTKPKCFDSLGKVINTKFKNPLSQSVMETLAIIAYNQPCRRSVIEKIRAKDPKAAIDRLLSLELITAKQSDLPGRPFVYTVTSKFYDLFDLKSLSQLPRIETKLLNDLPTNESEIDD